MGNKIDKEIIEAKMNIYIGSVFDKIQDILSKKEKSIDINLDIEMKIYAKLHQTLLAVKKSLIDEEGGED